MNEFIDVIQQLIAMVHEPVILIGLAISSLFGLLVPFSIATALGYAVTTETMVLVLAGLMVVLAVVFAYDYFETKRERAHRRAAHP